jgi:hypothetical protein
MLKLGGRRNAGAKVNGSGGHERHRPGESFGAVTIRGMDGPVDLNPIRRLVAPTDA